MGNCTSTSDRQAKAHSDAIDKEIENDSKKFRKECKILLLGALGISILGFHVQFALLASNALSGAYYMGGCVSPTMLRSTRVTRTSENGLALICLSLFNRRAQPMLRARLGMQEARQPLPPRTSTYHTLVASRRAVRHLLAAS
jgi:hypothetical protein